MQICVVQYSLWEVDGGRPRATLEGHTGGVWAVPLSADGQTVASGSLDGTVKLWDAGSFSVLRTLRPDRRYERMDITGLTTGGRIQTKVARWLSRKHLV
jgi:WD40 repeat protein